MSLLFWLAIAISLMQANCNAAKVSNVPKLLELVDELNNPEDTNATITCSLGSGELQSLSYEWFKDKNRIHAIPNKIRIDVPSDNYQSVLRIFDLKPTDSALYSCVAKNRFGQDKIETKLNVKVQLKWTTEPSGLSSPVGRMVHVPCSAEGIPSPRIEWRKLGTPKDEILGPLLRFSSIEQRDAGNYECRASNGVEEDLRTSIKIDVLGKYYQFERFTVSLVNHSGQFVCITILNKIHSNLQAL